MSSFKIDSSHTHYAMSRNNPPALSVESGDSVTFITYDCFGNQITTSAMTLGELDWDHINPATGPLFVNGAEPGDTLEISIIAIRIAHRAAMVSGPGLGLAGESITENQIRFLPIVNGLVEFSPTLKLVVKPMIGVIGTAPAGEPVSNGTPGPHGGNMDCRLITAGSTLYLPVNVAGGLLAMGDLHAAMGDGEVAVCGAEIAGEVDIIVKVIKGRPYPLPFIKTAQAVYAIYSAETVDAALTGVSNMMNEHLVAKGMDPHDALILLSLTGNLQICQVVDPLKTVRFELPLDVYLKI